MEKRGKGRPKKLDKVVKTLNYELTPRQLKLQLGEVYLKFHTSTQDPKVLKEYFNLIENYPIEDFTGKGFNLFKKFLNDAKSKSRSKNPSEG